jgi:hypothetical protein
MLSLNGRDPKPTTNTNKTISEEKKPELLILFPLL